MWDKAFLEQARSDWATYKLLQENSVVDCHPLHYLQMTTEKLGKAMLFRGGTNPDQVKKSHKGFTNFLRKAKRNSNLRKALNINRSSQLQQYINEILPIAHEIECLAPALSQDGPNVEYPWKNPTGDVLVPASYTFPTALELKRFQGRKLLTLINILLEKFEFFF